MSSFGTGRPAAGRTVTRDVIVLHVAQEPEPTPEAIEFVRYCFLRSGMVWPALYDDMCAAASRGSFRGLSYDELSAFGVSFALMELPRLAALSQRVIAEELALRQTA